MATLTILPTTHWLNGWFLKLFSVPVLRVGGVDVVGSWGEPTVVEVDAGLVHVSVGARYRLSGSVLGAVESTFQVGEGESISLRARNGFFNHTPFQVSEIPQSAH